MLLLSASEQAALQDWQWGLAWLLTFSSEPPWARIRAHPPAASELRSVGRLADPTLLAAAVGHMKDLMAISEAQKKVVPQALPNPRLPKESGEAGNRGAGRGARRRGGKGSDSSAADAAVAER